MSMSVGTIQDSIGSKFQRTQDFLPYIEEIRFPMYKSLEDGFTLQLDWPIVALVGPNGTNKSSVLQALSAAPEGRSLAEFWFSTEVDDIDKGVRGQATHRFVYKYKFDSSGVSAECRKYRGRRKYRSHEVPQPLRGRLDPDYWEPTKRVSSDGMAEIPEVGYDNWVSSKRDRWNLIQKPVVYLDFRSELSAFDKYIHHQSFDYWTKDSAQKRYKAVLRSKWIAKALSGKTLPKDQQAKLVQPVREISKDDVTSIAMILGKPIERISIVEHKFFGPTGHTVKLRLEGTGAAYSEAHAGSGEYAVVRLVDSIRRAKKGSLILLDEPEVSLHPGAQTELLRFIEREVLSHGHQVVFSTHSPTLAAGLPSKAIKVLGFDPHSQRIKLIADGCTPTEAFVHLGHATTPSIRPRVLVEDDLAAELVKAALRRHSPARLDNLEIIAFPGGADGIVKNVLSAFALTKVSNVGILLDGDQMRDAPDIRQSSAPEAIVALQTGDQTKLRQIWKQRFHNSEPNLYSHSDYSTDSESLFSCIDWASKHLDFLPGKQPEEALAKAEDPSLSHGDWKAYWRERSAAELHLTPVEATVIQAEKILSRQVSALAHLPDDSGLLKEIFDSIDRIIDW